MVPFHLILALCSALVERDLPFDAQPVFVRIQKTTEITASFKLVKGALREEAFHPDKIWWRSYLRSATPI
jgi:hypothetical protein